MEVKKSISKPNIIRFLVVVTFLLLLSFQLKAVSNLQEAYDSKTATYNMGYKQLLDDLSSRFGSGGTLLIPVLETGTTYWSDFNVINLNERIQLHTLEIDEIMNSNNLTLLLDFFAEYNIKFIILPSEDNWYYELYNQKFLNQEIYLEKYYPKLNLLIESTQNLIPVISSAFVEPDIVSNCESLEGWSTSGDSILLDNIDYKKENNSIIANGASKSDDWFQLIFDYQQPMNWSEYNHLNMWLKFESNSPPDFFSVAIHSTLNNGSKDIEIVSWWNLKYYQELYNSNWFEISLDLTSPDYSDGIGTNLNNVIDILVTLHDQSANVISIHVDDLVLYRSEKTDFFDNYNPYDYYNVFIIPQNDTNNIQLDK